MLRKNAGGFHATTKSGCIFVSAIMIILAFFIFVSFDHSMFFYSLCVAITGSVIWLIAPIDNPVKRLDPIGYKVFKKRSRVILCVEGMLFVLAVHFQWITLVRSTAMVFSVVLISLLLGMVKNARMHIPIRQENDST